MALGKKDARKIVAVLKTNLAKAAIENLMNGLKKADIKNKSFRKTMKRIRKELERAIQPAVKKAA